MQKQKIDIEKTKYDLIYDFIVSSNVEIQIKKVKNINPNACYFRNIITLFVPEKYLKYSVLTSLLLHEYGHHLAARAVGIWNHSEVDAWEIGRNCVPKMLLPENFNYIKKMALKTYKNPYGVGQENG